MVQYLTDDPLVHTLSSLAFYSLSIGSSSGGVQLGAVVRACNLAAWKINITKHLSPTKPVSNEISSPFNTNMTNKCCEVSICNRILRNFCNRILQNFSGRTICFLEPQFLYNTPLMSSSLFHSRSMRVVSLCSPFFSDLEGQCLLCFHCTT